MKRSLLTVGMLVIGTLTGAASVMLLAQDRGGFKEELKKSADREAYAVEREFADDNPFGELDRPTPSNPARDQFLRLASEYATLGDDGELQRMAEELQLKITAQKADRKVSEAEKILQEVVAQFPATDAAKRAVKMLEALHPDLPKIPLQNLK